MKLGLRSRGSRGRKRSIALWCGVGLFVAVVLLSILVPIFSAYGPNQLVAKPFQAPSASHLFGTDALGRDLFVRVWAGGRLDLAIAFIVVGISFLVGTLIGIATGASHRRWLDSLVMRFIDALIAFPFLVLILALIVVVGRDRSAWVLPAGAPAIIIAILLIDWSIYGRLARGETLSLRSRDFVTAGQMIGYPQRRIVSRHLLPGVMRITAAYAVADVILVIVATASLSFLGAGVQAPTAEWGSIMYEGRTVLANAWWVSVIPGVVLAFTGLAVGLIADALLNVER
ncbi:MAG: ABC transporter permease [Actinobacteria bacterium]|nr:ABC transporter permease [Actinomycetota bacterium]